MYAICQSFVENINKLLKSASLGAKLDSRYLLYLLEFALVRKDLGKIKFLLQSVLAVEEFTANLIFLDEVPHCDTDYF